MAEKNKLSIVVFSGELDRALCAFMLAITSASMAMEVSLFFTFWGLNIIKKSHGKTKSKGILKKMLNIFNRGGSERLKLSKFNMMGLGTLMIKRMMKDISMPSIDELITMAKESGVKFIACTTSMELMGMDKESFREDIVDEVAGAAYFLNEASKGKITLFI